MKNINKRRLSSIFLILGMAAFAIGWSTDNTIYSWASVVFIMLSLILGGRWMRPRKK